jgi:hypothetical protein
VPLQHRLVSLRVVKNFGGRYNNGRAISFSYKLCFISAECLQCPQEECSRVVFMVLCGAGEGRRSPRPPLLPTRMRRAGEDAFCRRLAFSLKNEVSHHTKLEIRICLRNAHTAYLQESQQGYLPRGTAFCDGDFLSVLQDVLHNLQAKGGVAKHGRQCQPDDYFFAKCSKRVEWVELKTGKIEANEQIQPIECARAAAASKGEP